MITISNDILSVEISELGAELQHVVYNGKQMLWNGDPAVWSGIAPIMFPICGGLKDDRFTYKKKSYTLTKHGFAKKSVFTVEQQSKTSATLLLSSSPETLAQYPWEFELRVTYSLSGKRLHVHYDVTNCSEDTMITAIGSHEAYACPDGIENYDILFEKEETLDALPLNGNLLMRKTYRVLFESRTLPLFEKYFDIDALVFADVKSRFVTLRNRIDGRQISISFPGMDNLLLWHKPQGKYICIEPWSGLPSFEDTAEELTAKESMEQVLPGEHLVRSHDIFF